MIEDDKILKGDKQRTPIWVAPVCLLLSGISYAGGFFVGHNTEDNKVSDGPYVVEVESIYDGDTFFAHIEELPDIFGERIGIRIKGIDTPEIRGTDGLEKQLALEARSYVATRLREANKVEIANIERDKYFRLVATVYADQENIGLSLCNKGLALRYDGDEKPDWDAFIAERYK